MRIGFLFIGLLLVFAGLAISGISRNPVSVEDKDLQIIAEGLRDVPEVSNVNLTKGDIFVAKYSGGGSQVDPNDVIVNVFDPYGNLTAGISYTTQFLEGTLANYTGPYRIQVGGPGLIDPSYPMQIVIYKMIISNRTEYPNSDLLPLGIALVLAGSVVCIVGVISQRRTPKRIRRIAG